MFRRPFAPLSSRRSRRGALAVLTTLALAVITAPSGATAAAATGADAWTSPYAGGANSGYDPGESALTTANVGRLRQAWSLQNFQGPYVPPTIVSGVAYYVIKDLGGTEGPLFMATSVRTGATLWKLSLSGQQQFWLGASVVGNLAVLPFNGLWGPGGVTAVDLTSHRVAWTSYLPATALPEMGNEQTGQLVTDGTRAFVGGAGYAVNAYRLSDGAHLWSAAFERDSQGGIVAPAGMAASNGVLYTGSHQSITARSAATGRQLWVVPGGFEAPVVAGGRVFVPTRTGVAAAAAGGCGAPVCPLLWQRALGQPYLPPQLGGADGSTLFAAYFVPGGSEGIGHLTRLSAATGAVQWSATAGITFDRPARAGNVVFVRNWYRDASGLAGYRLLAYSAAATGPGYLRAIPKAGDGDGGGVAVAGGSVLVKVWSGPLIGYRVPGT